MIQSSFSKVWELLDPQERRNAFKLLLVIVIGAVASATMVASVFPFLAILANPDMIREVPALAWAYRVGGFSSDYSFLVGLGLGAMGVILLTNMLLILQVWAQARFTQMRVRSICQRLLAHYLSQPYEFFIARHSGDMSTNILSEVQQVIGQVFIPFANVISSSLTLIAVTSVLLVAEPVVATVAVVTFSIIYATVSVLSRRYTSTLGKRRAAAQQARFRITGEALGGIKDVKLLGREEKYLERFDVPSLAMAQSQIGVAVLTQTPRYAVQIAAFGGIIVLCLVILDPNGLQEREALGDILPLLGLLAFAGQRLMPEFQKLYQSIAQIAAGSAALDRVYGDLSLGSTVQLEKGRPAPLGLHKTLSLTGIGYTYPNADRAGLSEVALEIQAGERIGIVGSSGAGKTTLADVLLGLLTPNVGEILVDGKPVKGDNLRAWRRTVGYVPQDIFLIDATLSENIALGLSPEEICNDKVEHAARIAQLHEFVLEELPDGYATFIGERGVRLSGGQRQRIGIARALYNDADLIVFDEATSALDNMTEKEVMSALDALLNNKTVVMIAHRLTTVKACNRIVVMKEGKVVACGSWEELIRTNPYFRLMAENA